MTTLRDLIDKLIVGAWYYRWPIVLCVGMAFFIAVGWEIVG